MQGTLNGLILDRLDDLQGPDAWRVEAAPGQWRGMPRAEARDHVLAVASAVARQGLAPGDRAAILAPTRPEWVLADLGFLLARVVTVGIYPTCTPEQVAYQLRHSGARLLVLPAAELPRLRGALDGVESLQRLVLLDDPSWHAFLAEGRGGDEEARARAAGAAPDDVVTLVYTSGTTGDPKGAMLTHRNLVHVCEAVLRTLPLDPDDRALVFLPLAHILQRYTVYLGLRAGLDGWFLPDMHRLGEVLPVVRPSVLAVVPRVLEKVQARALAARAALPARRQRVFDWAFRVGHAVAGLAEVGEAPGLWLRAQHRIADRLVLRKVRDRLGGRLRLVVSGGAPLDPTLARWFDAAGIPVLEGYGLTETSAPATTNLPQARRIGSVGRAVADTDLRIDDDGEILVRGPGVFVGYWQDPEATASVLQDGWFRTGDIGELHDGFLRITDRKKELIVTAAGKNIAPSPIEGRLAAHRLVGQAAVIGDRRPYLVALIGLDPEEAPGWAAERGLPQDLPSLAAHPTVVAELEAWVQSVNGGLPPYETIKRHALLGEPIDISSGLLTPTLKLRRRQVVARYADRIDALYPP